MFRLGTRKQEPVTDTVAPEVYPADDHALHLADEACARCGRPIKPNEEARRRASGDCVHLSC
jgi:hypothetical protein